jgi:hypothetical protein
MWVTTAPAAALHACLALHITRTPLPTACQFSWCSCCITTSTALPLGPCSNATSFVSWTSTSSALTGTCTLRWFLEICHVNLEGTTEVLIRRMCQYFQHVTHLVTILQGCVPYCIILIVRGFLKKSSLVFSQSPILAWQTELNAHTYTLFPHYTL